MFSAISAASTGHVAEAPRRHLAGDSLRPSNGSNTHDNLDGNFRGDLHGDSPYRTGSSVPSGGLRF